VGRAEWALRIAVAFCLLYGAAVVVQRSPEHFPFFAWDLFVRVPRGTDTDYGIRIVTRDGETTTQYLDAGKLLNPAQKQNAQQAVQAFGRAVQHGDATAAAVLQRWLAKAYFTPKRVQRYELVRRTYDLRTHGECHCYTREDVLGEYKLQ